MKRTPIGILTALTVLTLGTTSVLAAGPGYGRNWTDTNGNGICDFAESTGRYLDADQDGIWDRARQAGYCKHFIDADGDGICDNYGGQGTGRGNGCRGGRIRS